MTSPIEVEFPDIRRWQDGNSGIPYVWSWQAAEPGPHVAITALVHGNEVCGAIALDHLLPAFNSGERRPRRGRLSFAFVNVAAYLSFDPAQALASRCLDEDCNRLWDEATLSGPRQSRELARARELRPFIDTIDHLLDLHSMTLPAPPIALAGDTAKGLALARAIGIPADILIDSGHAAGRRLRDYAAFADPASPRSALLIECGQHWEAQVGKRALAYCERFLEQFAMVEPNLDSRPTDPPQRVIEIAAVITASRDFHWLRPVQGSETIPQAGTVLAMNDGEEVTTPHKGAILIMPALDPKPGQTAVRIGRVVPS